MERMRTIRNERNKDMERERQEYEMRETRRSQNLRDKEMK